MTSTAGLAILGAAPSNERNRGFWSIISPPACSLLLPVLVSTDPKFARLASHPPSISTGRRVGRMIGNRDGFSFAKVIWGGARAAVAKRRLGLGLFNRRMNSAVDSLYFQQIGTSEETVYCRPRRSAVAIMPGRAGDHSLTGGSYSCLVDCEADSHSRRVFAEIGSMPKLFLGGSER